MQTQTKDALTRLFQKGSVSFGSVKDIRGSLKRLEIGSSLGIMEILSFRTGKRIRPDLPSGFCDHHEKRPVLYSGQSRI